MNEKEYILKCNYCGMEVKFIGKDDDICKYCKGKDSNLCNYCEVKAPLEDIFCDYCSNIVKKKYERF